jgi:Cell morphogenesis C-terminal
MRGTSAEGVQPLVLKGSMLVESRESVIKILSCITIPISDSIFDKQETCLSMHITGLLHWLGL